MPSEIGANLSLGGVSLAVAFKTKNSELRQTAAQRVSHGDYGGVAAVFVMQSPTEFGQDAQATIRLLKDGCYNNQRFIVPTEQLDEIRKAFPGKSVSDVLGGTETVPTCSEGMTKAQAKSARLHWTKVVFNSLKEITKEMIYLPR